MEEYTPEYITIYSEDGTEELLEILFTFNSEEYNKDYVVCAKDIVTEDGEDGYEIYSFSYVEKDGTDGEIFEIDDPAEQAMVEEAINSFFEEAEEAECGCGCGCHHDHE